MLKYPKMVVESGSNSRNVSAREQLLALTPFHVKRRTCYHIIHKFKEQISQRRRTRALRDKRLAADGLQMEMGGKSKSMVVEKCNVTTKAN
jgi:hypothetical protein